jgi:hypothetical protein
MSHMFLKVSPLNGRSEMNNNDLLFYFSFTQKKPQHKKKETNT